MNQCNLEGCDRKQRAKGFCSRHYTQFRKGKLGDTIEIKQDGRTSHPLYNGWRGMKQRCFDVNSTQFKYYGGRGITVCERWLNSFAAFLEDMGERPKNHTLDRINNDGNYEPSNCRWASQTEQNINKGMQTNNTSGVKGVYWSKVANKWSAKITVNKKHIHLGVFSKKEDARKARKEAEELFFNGLDNFLIIIQMSM
jgi:hypothetical protein